ncbi:MAG TPA: carboxypeptidase-like regulatory domain-containing protein [Bryobacteraceae bacterium]|nr:carboxypeptidase-like regulatory domain-containing protein [Bryobacteraceae bacterium]
MGLGCSTTVVLPYIEADNGCVRRSTAIALTCAFFVTSAKAVRELVVIEELQQARQVEGFVLDPSGAPISDMTVTDRSEQWVAVLRSTTTDSRGHFRFARQRGKTVYYLRFDHKMFNPLELRLKLDKNAPQRAITARPEIGG